MYGAPVTAPMEIPWIPPSAFAQVPLEEMPEIKDATTGTLRLEGTLAKRMPSMPSGDLDNLSFTNSRQIEAAQLMNDMRNSYSISRTQQRLSNNRAKAKSRAAQRQADRASSAAANSLSKTQGRSQRYKKSTTLRNARDVLGMGTDLYR